MSDKVAFTAKVSEKSRRVLNHVCIEYGVTQGEVLDILLGNKISVNAAGVLAKREKEKAK